MIKTENVSKTYPNGLHAVENCNLNIEEGDVFGFLGLNGAGKTTTIRMLTGLLKPTSGKIWINGLELHQHQEKIKSVIGVLPESHGYYPWMTAYEYLQFFYRLYGGKKEDENPTIVSLLQKVGLYDRKNSKVSQFSRGMKQRLGIAKTLIHGPKIIFLDEPTLGLDPAGQKEIQDVIRELSKKEKVTVFITSHLLKDIEVLCNKIAIIDKGKLLASDSIHNLQEKHTLFHTLHVRTSSNEKALNLLQVLNGYHEMVLDEGIIKIAVIKTTDINVFKQKLIEILILNKIDIYELKSVETTVEEIFMEVINHQLGGNHENTHH